MPEVVTRAVIAGPARLKRPALRPFFTFLAYYTLKERSLRPSRHFPTLNKPFREPTAIMGLGQKIKVGPVSLR